MKDIFNKRQRFSIRKFSVGVASVLIGIALFAPSQGVLASTENNVATEIGANSEKENATPTVEKKEENQNSPENQGAISSPAPKDTPIISTRTTELETSGDKENNSLTTRASVAGEDRSSLPAVRAASNPSEIKKYELTKEDAKKIKAGVIGSEGNKLDSLLLNGPELSPEAYTDDDFLKDKEEIYIYEKGGKKYVGYNSHPLLEDTDGDGIIDSKEKPDEKLKWNVSERDMIMFMELSYRDDNYIDRVLNHKKPLTESELYKKNDDSRPRYEYMMMNKELGPYWERKKSYHTSSGLDAVLYETKSDFSYLPNGTAQVLAFRGTSDAKDIGTDITLGLGSNPQQGIDAENIMRELAKDKSITNLYLTGHSLGGYLVQRAMVEAYQLAYSDSRVMSSKEQRAYRNFYNNVLKKGTTFNAPKVRTSYFSSSEFWQKGLDSKNIAKSGKMTHYIVNNDSTIGKSVSNDSDVVINVGNTKGGHSSRSYFEADMINRRSEFMSGKRISLDGTGYQDKKMTTAKSVEKVGETVVYSKRGDDIIKSTTVSIKDPDTGQITKNTLDEVFKKDGAKSTVVVTSIEPSVRYEKDATRAKGGANVTEAGTPGTRTVTTTYTVNPTDGSLVSHEEPAVVVPSKPTVVKVPAKDEVTYLKEGDDVVKKITTYMVNASTGALTPTEKKEIFKQNGAKAQVVVTPLQPSVRYEKDATRAKGGKNVTTAGTSGTRTVTTTYTVNPADGSLIPHEGKPVIKQSTPTVVKVPAKDEVEYLKDGDDVVKKTTTYAVNASTGALTPTVRKDVANPKGAKSKIVVTPLKPNVRYEKDATRAKGEAKITVAGTSGTRTVTTTYTVNPTDGRLIPHEGKPVIKSSTPTVVKVPAKDEVEYLKDGDDVVKKTTTYAVNASTGTLTPTVRKDVANPKGAKSKVVVTPLEPSIRYEKDATRAKGEANATTAGTPGTRTVTTTYTVNPTDGSLIPHEGPAVEVPSKSTVVKVPAKDEVEYLKEGDDVVKKTITYAVDASTGSLTPTETTEIFTQNGAKSKVVVTSLEPSVRYEKDATKVKGGETITIAGTPGTRTVTTTYTVNPADGRLISHEGKPVIKSSTPTVVKVPAKDEIEYLRDGDDVVKKTTTYAVNASTGTLTPTEKKEVFKKAGAKSKVVVTSIEPSVRYEKDATRAKGESNVTTAGTQGTRTVTTTYTVNPTDGSLIPHEGKPVIKPSTPTVIRVPAKDEVEYLKEGYDVVKKTITYAVDASTGSLTPTETTEIFKRNGAKSKVVVTPLEPSVRYEKDATRAKGGETITVAGTPGTRTVTTTYTVNPTDGSLIPHEEPAVVVPSKPTVIKMPAKDEVEYLKDGDNVVKKTTTYAVNVSTGHLTPTEKKEVFKKDGAKSTVVVTSIEPSVRYEKDATKVKGGETITVAGTPGTRTVTTTYTVNPTDGLLIPHEEPAVEVPSTPTVVKVPAKDEIEYFKEGDDVVKKTTTYSVNASTGSLTPTETTEIFTQNGAKSTVVVTSLEPSVRYEKDATRAKGGETITVAGTPGTRTVTTTYTVNPTDGLLIPHEEPAVVVPSKSTVVKVPAKDEVEYLKEGDNVVKKTTTYAVNTSTGALTSTEKKEVFKKDGAKTKVVVTPIEPSVRYEKDATRDKGGKNVTTSGTQGTSTVTTTYTVNPTDGSLIPHEEPAVVVPSKPTVIKVPAKNEVAYLKEGDDVVKKTITYAVNASTGALTPTEKKEIFTQNVAKSKVVVTQIEQSVRYEKDATRAKGGETITVAGTPGTRTVTTTYTVNPTDGSLIPHEESAVAVPSTPTVVKVPAKDEIEYLRDGDDVVKKTTSYEVNASTGALTPTVRKDITSPNGAKSTVVVTPLEPSVRYEKDATRAKGEANATTAGTPGTRTVTTTYTVNPTDGSLIPHEEPAVVVPSTPTMVKVPAKDEIEYLKEGDDVVKKTTTYEVNASTGALTPTEKKEVFKKDGAKAKVVVTQIEPSVRYEKDATRAKGGETVTVVGTPGTRTVTTTYTVNPTDGSLIPHEGPAVEVSSTPTVIKVPAKDEIEYLKDGDDVVKKTITYAVNASTGALTPTEKKEIFTQNVAKSKVVVTQIEQSVRYEKDATRVKGGETITVAGTPGTRTVTTTYTVNPTDGSLIPHEESAVAVPSTPTVIKVPAKDEVEYLKEGDNVVKKITTYAVDASTGSLTPTETTEIFKRNGAKSKVVVTSIEPSVRYEKDATKVKGGETITVAGTLGIRTVTTTYTVNPADGRLISHEGKPVIKSSTPTVVKVPAQDEIEYLRDGDDVVKKTTSYEVNASTGALTPTVRKDITSPNGAKSTVVVTPLEPSVRYEKDATRAKGESNVTVAGVPGTRIVTTTYTVNSTDGSLIPHEGKPVIKSSTTTVIKVPAKDKVVETLIEPEVEYVKDVEKDFGTPDQRTEGEKGKTVTTTTYDVDPKDGHITEHLGNPVVTPAGKTIVKVGAKTKVEHSKDPEGRDVIDTITYGVDPKTGKVTPTTTTTYGPISKKGEPEVQTDIPEYTNPISSNGVDGNRNLIDSPTVELPEFKGGVNGELPGPITLPELTIEVHWIDEDGNVLKPSVKTGNEKDAEHGSILGYEFVRTVIDENEPVITYIFRKVSGTTNTIPVTPDTNGNSGHDTPAPTPATPTPNAVTPNTDQVDTKTTVDNGAKSNDSQTVLPNTGTESNATLASLGLLGMLGGLGLALGKKKED
ncbi:G5 domain-containing protein [Streptococcus sp. 714]|uniref:G5 domain-containing protein n=1 Tax=Streptococcus sp. 714 TaxID=2582653 RepID=UPI0015677200|nr:G5 domain-containing protein [Streptococcus sp. 714]